VKSLPISSDLEYTGRLNLRPAHIAWPAIILNAAYGLALRTYVRITIVKKYTFIVSYL